MLKRLIVITGPTAVGKTDISIQVAQKYGSPVISCDSRQIFKEMNIGTAVPDASQLAAVKHYFIQSVPVTESYSAGQYEIDALELIDRLFAEGHDTLVMSGGSGFYVDAVCNGLDNLPVAPPELREELTRRVREEGVAALAEELKKLDPLSWAAIGRSWSLNSMLRRNVTSALTKSALPVRGRRFIPASTGVCSRWSTPGWWMKCGRCGRTGIVLRCKPLVIRKFSNISTARFHSKRPSGSSNAIPVTMRKNS